MARSRLYLIRVDRHIAAMAILKIARMGNPILRERAQEVEDPKAPAVHALVRDMAETLVDAQGAGLAAPQVYVPYRVVIFYIPQSDEEEYSPPTEEYTEEPVRNLEVLINPVIEPIGDEKAFGWEGCLSVPDMQGIVPRFTHIRYSGVGLDGKPIKREAKGFHARVLQHECDHLDGVLYPMQITDLRLFGFNEEFERNPLRLESEEEEADTESS
ncbi:MAG: peptide deformylase [Alphaproteobacteria bacterium]|jgi:peptide deformylase